ncbi:TatD family hydrolase [Candidatus Saccharibacteria bacterium]|nr:TatD family hydrolase [Candidatus Saccharibacteria bacterium]
MLIDSHCHIHDTDTYKFALSRVQKKEKPGVEYYTPEKLLARAKENGIEKLICIGTNHEDSLKARDFAKNHENVFWSYGIHPDEACDFNMGDASRGTPDALRAEGANAVGDDSRQDPMLKLQAIGEIGLDYRNGTKTREAQFKLLEQMLQLAKDNNLPCIFHVREAFDDFFAVLRNFPGIKAVVHSFSDSKENLDKCLNEGFYIGVNGLSTFANIPLPPLERVLLETDSPFLAPVPHRGEVDEPAFVKNIASFLAIHYQTTFDNVAKITTENAERLFKI